MKRRIFALLMVLVMCLMISVPAFASPADLILATSSDAAYGIMPIADESSSGVEDSLASVTNTISYGASQMVLRLYKPGTSTYITKYVNLSDKGRATFVVPDGYECGMLGVSLKSGSLPSPGKYRVEIKLGSDASVTYDSSLRVYAVQKYANVASEDDYMTTALSQISGDFYSAFTMDIGSVTSLMMYAYIPANNRVPAGGAVGGTFSVNFTRLDASADTGLSVGSDTTTSDYQSSTTSFLGDIVDFFSSLLGKQDTISGNITNFASNVTSSFTNLGSSITNKLSDVLSGIQSGLDDVTDGITSKLTSITDKITGGYDSSGITTDNNQLDKTLDDYAADEDKVLEQISEPINNFEFDNPVTQYLSTFLLFGNFLQDVFTGSGGMADVINLSFMMGIALMVAGLYRFKGGN